MRTERFTLSANLSAGALALAIPLWGVIGALSFTLQIEADVDRFFLMGLMTWTLGSLFVYLAARILDGQRQLAERQRIALQMLEGEHDAGTRVVQLGDRIAKRLVDSDR